MVIDDEPIARKILKGYIEQIPLLENAGECKNSLEALELINQDETIEIIFLDINMPNLSGISMVKILSRKPQIIFTSAYSEFAIESYELDAADYLLKPFLFERFAKAVYKAIERLKDFSHLQKTTSTQQENSIFIKSNGETFPVSVNEIMFCEAMKNYTKVVMTNGRTFHPLIPLSKFEEELSSLSNNFFRAHRSYIISRMHLSSIGSNYVMIDKVKIPIGNQYKDGFLAQIGMSK